MLKRYRDKPFEESAARADEFAAGIPRYRRQSADQVDRLISCKHANA
jgi:hypothetical protein